MKRLVTFCFIGFGLTSCSVDKQQEKETDELKMGQQIVAKPTYKSDSSIAALRVINDSQTTPSSSFSAFWDNFRAAILNQDTIKIIALTHFPFQTRGELDSDPVIEYSKDEFPFVLQTYLQQQEYTALNEEQSEFELIKATTDVRKEQQTGDWVRIGDMEFKRMGKEWKLVFAYLSRETREKLEKHNNAR